MKETDTPYGKLFVGSAGELFRHAVTEMERARVGAALDRTSCALTGGSTPAAFYRFVVNERLFPESLLRSAAWFTSDERMVPLDSDESNFGNADRMLLQPMNVPEEMKFPWPVDRNPGEAVEIFNDIWHRRFSQTDCFDTCFLGMGDDCHTASWFPGSPLLRNREKAFFANVDVPGKGSRLTITPAGLARCGMVIVMVTGKSKATALKAALESLCQPEVRPVQWLANVAEKTVWLVDEDAASELNV